jgi:hypothetical protein
MDGVLLGAGALIMRTDALKRIAVRRTEPR